MNVFTVQRLGDDTTPPKVEFVTVEAECTLKAGEQVLAESLSLHGQIAKAKVWHLKSDFTPDVTTLYAAETK